MGGGATSRRNVIINYGRYRPHRVRERFSQLVCDTSVPTLSRLPGKQYLRSSAFTQSGPRSPTWRSTDETLEADSEVKSEYALRRLLTGGGGNGLCVWAPSPSFPRTKYRGMACQCLRGKFFIKGRAEFQFKNNIASLTKRNSDSLTSVLKVKSHTKIWSSF